MVFKRGETGAETDTVWGSPRHLQKDAWRRDAPDSVKQFEQKIAKLGLCGAIRS